MARLPDTPDMDGVLVIAKPAGPTSHDIVALVRRLAGVRRVGHGGTLDPFASGVLPLFIGRATRMAEYHLADGKAYRATICFGATSPTDDLDGELVPVAAPAPTRSEAEAALATFTGTIRQRPPDYSAVAVGGRRAYAIARAGGTPELAERTVTIRRLELVEWIADDPSRPIAVVEVECSAGTYVRAIARDLGATLGCGAYLGGLVRTASGPFRLDVALGPDALRAAAADGPAGLRPLLLPPDAGLEGLGDVRLTETEVGDVARGRFVRPAGGLTGIAEDVPVRLHDAAGRLIGIGRRDGRRIAPEKILVDAPAGTASAS